MNPIDTFPCRLINATAYIVQVPSVSTSAVWTKVLNSPVKHNKVRGQPSLRLQVTPGF